MIRLVRGVVITAIVAATAPMALLSTSPAAAQAAVTARDEFRSVSYGGNDGSIDFSGPWIERGEADGPGVGALRVAPSDRCTGGAGNCLHVGLEGGDLGPFAIDRRVDLDGATEASFTFRWRRDSQGQVAGAVRVRVSGNGGGSWTTLTTIALAGSQGASSESFDITPWAGDSTVIRFDGTGTDVDGYLTVDDVQIAAVIVPPTTTTAPPTTTTLPNTTTTTVATTTTQPGATTTTTSPSTTSVPGVTTTTTLPDSTSTTIPGVTPTTTPGSSTTTTAPAATTSTTTPTTDSTAPDGDATTTTTPEGTATSTPPAGDGTEPSDAPDDAAPPTNGSAISDDPDAGHGDDAEALSPSAGADSSTTRPLVLIGAQLVILGALVATLAAVGITSGRPPSA